MQQRQLRLGDILDDYCPRERRVTNHAVVAMVGDDVKQTRCTTCDTEHEYKARKGPRQRRKSDSPAALYAQVAAGCAQARATAHGRPRRHRNDGADAADAGGDRPAVDPRRVDHDEHADGTESPVDRTPEDDRRRRIGERTEDEPRIAKTTRGPCIGR